MNKVAVISEDEYTIYTLHSKTNTVRGYTVKYRCSEINYTTPSEQYWHFWRVLKHAMCSRRQKTASVWTVTNAYNKWNAI